MKKIKIYQGDIRYPKTDGIIIPANAQGLMTSGREAIIARTALSGVPKAVKEYVEKNKVQAGDCFSTYSGRMNKRKVEKIYHAVIRNLKSDFTSVFIISNAVNKAFRCAISDNLASVAICGIGIEDGEMDPILVANLIANICKKYIGQIEIKVIDDNEKFIKEIEKIFLEE